MIDLDEKQTTTGIIYIHCLDKIKELSADYSHADALDYCAAEASCALFCLTDAVLSLAGVDSRVTCETMYSVISGYRDYFELVYNNDFDRVVSEHLNTYSDCLHGRYSPPCFYNNGVAHDPSEPTAALLDTLADYLLFALWNDSTFRRGSSAPSMTALEMHGFREFFMGRIQPLVMWYFDFLVQIFSDELCAEAEGNGNKPNPTPVPPAAAASKRPNKPKRKIKLFPRLSKLLVKIDDPGIVVFGVLVALLLIFVFVQIISGGAGNDRAQPAPTAEITQPPRETLTPVYIFNGKILKSPMYESLCPLTVSVRGDEGYYVYLDYQYAPADSRTERRKLPTATKTNPDVGFYVAPGSSVSIDVPIGVYKLYYACGETWYGPRDLFGEDTTYSSSSELLKFYDDGTYYMGHTLELWRQSGGNFSTYSVDESDFPG